MDNYNRSIMDSVRDLQNRMEGYGRPRVTSVTYEFDAPVLRRTVSIPMPRVTKRTVYAIPTVNVEPSFELYFDDSIDNRTVSASEKELLEAVRLVRLIKES